MYWGSGLKGWGRGAKAGAFGTGQVGETTKEGGGVAPVPPAGRGRAGHSTAADFWSRTA